MGLAAEFELALGFAGVFGFGETALGALEGALVVADVAVKFIDSARTLAALPGRLGAMVSVRRPGSGVARSCSCSSWQRSRFQAAIIMVSTRRSSVGVTAWNSARRSRSRASNSSRSAGAILVAVRPCLKELALEEALPARDGPVDCSESSRLAVIWAGEDMLFFSTPFEHGVCLGSEIAVRMWLWRFRK